MSFSNWEKFEDLLYSLSEQPGYKPKKGERKDGSPLITPAIYNPGTTRANRNVISWASWVAMDIDEYEDTFENTIETFKGHHFVCYSSASSSKEKPKFRIVFPLTKEVKADKIKHLWFAANKEYNSLGDPQTKDLSRMYYVPAQYQNAYNFIFTHNGPHLDPDKLMSKHAFVNNQSNTFGSNFSDAIQEELRKHFKNKLTNTNITWSGWRDCPFVNKQLVAEYTTINESGWYHHMYRIMMSIAANAIRRGYPITPEDVEALVREIDMENGGWYKGRPVRLEASRAIDFALSKGQFA
jgi:hypothetical protein